MKYVIRKEDLVWEFFRAGGKGGQKQNKTSSAARVTHVPTGLKGESRVERSQTQNRRRAIEILIEKIMAMHRNDTDAMRQAEYREKTRASFGSQTRSYFMIGKDSRVVDHVTGQESRDVHSVLDGNIDPFIEAKLRERI